MVYLNTILKLANQIFDIEKRVLQKSELQSLSRNVERLKNTFEEFDLVVHNPLNEAYSETRTDCEASIVGTKTDRLVITDVIKPIIYQRNGTTMILVQKGVVLVESK